MYKHNFQSKQELRDLGFQYSHFFDGYTLRFPVATWNNQSVLDGLITIFIIDGRIQPKIKVDVVDTNTINSYYFPFYISDAVHKDFIKSIRKNIHNKLIEIGIEKVPNHTHKQKKG